MTGHLIILGKSITVDGVTDNLTGWAKRLGVALSTLSKRVTAYGADRAIRMGRIQAAKDADLQQRLESNSIPVTETGCLLWLGGTNDGGYGQIHIGGRDLYVHRVAWELANKAKIPAGLSVLHSCDVPSCCRPDHLRVGTNKDNIADKVARGRQYRAFGEKSPTAVLSAEGALEIIRLDTEGLSPLEIATRLGVSREIVYCVRNGRTWTHVTGRRR